MSPARTLLAKAVHRRTYEVRGMAPMADPRGRAGHRVYFHPVQIDITIRNDQQITVVVEAVWPPVPQDSPAVEMNSAGRPFRLCRYTNFDPRSARLKEAPAWITDLLLELITDWEDL